MDEALRSPATLLGGPGVAKDFKSCEPIRNSTSSFVRSMTRTRAMSSFSMIAPRRQNRLSAPLPKRPASVSSDRRKIGTGGIFASRCGMVDWSVWPNCPIEIRRPIRPVLQTRGRSRVSPVGHRRRPVGGFAGDRSGGPRNIVPGDRLDRRSAELAFLAKFGFAHIESEIGMRCSRLGVRPAAKPLPVSLERVADPARRAADVAQIHNAAYRSDADFRRFTAEEMVDYLKGGELWIAREGLECSCVLLPRMRA